MQMKQKAWKDKRSCDFLESITPVAFKFSLRSFFPSENVCILCLLGKRKGNFSTVLLDYGTQPKFRHWNISSENHHASYNIVSLVVLFAQGNLRKRAAKWREAWDGKLIETNRSPGARFCGYTASYTVLPRMHTDSFRWFMVVFLFHFISRIFF